MGSPARNWQPLSLPGSAPRPAPAVAIAPAPARDRQPRLAPILVTKQQAAEILNVSESIIGRLIRNGELPVVRAEQRLVRLRVADLHAWAERHLCQGQSEDAAQSDSPLLPK